MSLWEVSLSIPTSKYSVFCSLSPEGSSASIPCHFSYKTFIVDFPAFNPRNQTGTTSKSIETVAFVSTKILSSYLRFLLSTIIFRMLKLHHMNLLNEIQETTLMMNLYQQQQLQQQQQQLQQRQASVEGLLPGTSSSKRGSLGLGSVGGDSTSEPAPKKAKSTPAASSKKDTAKPKDKADDKETAPDSEKQTPKSDLEAELLKSQKEQEALEAKLKKIKEDIARREKEAEELQKKADDVGAGSKPSKADDEKNDESDTASTKEEEKAEEES